MFTKAVSYILRQVVPKRMSEAAIHRWASLIARLFPSAAKKTAFQALSAQHAFQSSNLEDVEFLVYYGEARAQNHYKMWNPVFANLPGKYVSVFRSASAWWSMREDDMVIPVALLSHCDSLFERLPNLKAVFYPANNGSNLQAIRNTRFTHVFLGHGDSNKASSANKVFRLYDEVWVAGQAHIDRFAGTPGNYSAIDFRIVGQPWMQEWITARQDVDEKNLTDWAYLPTWHGYYANTNYSSLEDMSVIFHTVSNALAPECQGWIKLHPWTDASARQTAAALANAEPKLNVAPHTDALQNLLARPLRFVVCDISAALTECLYLNVPIFLYRPGPNAVLPSEFDEKYAFCYIFQNTAELSDLIKKVIDERQDNLASARTIAMGHLVDLEKTRDGQFLKELARISAQNIAN